MLFRKTASLYFDFLIIIVAKSCFARETASKVQGLNSGCGNSLEWYSDRKGRTGPLSGFLPPPPTPLSLNRLTRGWRVQWKRRHNHPNFMDQELNFLCIFNENWGKQVKTKMYYFTIKTPTEQMSYYFWHSTLYYKKLFLSQVH